jgi:small subunit ribosomal protein S17
MIVKKPVKAKKVEPKLKLRTTKGIVASDKMDKTVVVSVDSLKKHPKYHKRYLSTKKYKVHDPRNQFKKGDTVSFVSCRPISKDKRWRVVY